MTAREAVATALWREFLKHNRHQSGVHFTFQSACAAHPEFCKQFLDQAEAAIEAHVKWLESNGYEIKLTAEAEAENYRQAQWDE